MTVGRSEDSDVRMNDVSVSRKHSMLSYDGMQIMIKDNGSKFGTLRLLKSSIALKNNEPIKVQCGRTLLYLKARYPKFEKSKTSDDTAFESHETKKT